jgi:pyruvate-ferredoxin/flavodoxin oxidoreductase
VTRVVVDANEAVARVAYATSETVAIYPITPASPMGEHADAWAAEQRPNLWGVVPRIVEMQSEGGAAGALHGAIQRGSLATTFTASQGLLLMLPNLYKIAGELSPAVIHVAARTVATHALSIFGDHSDVMAVRQAGWAMLCSASVQEAQDFAAIAHAATLESRVPFLHFFDGFRTSHELNLIEPVDDDALRKLIDDDRVLEHRARGLSPERPVLRGSAQNPDVFFQAREAANPYHDAVPTIVQDVMDRFDAQTGRAYTLIGYHGHPEAERVLVLMGSGTGAARETVDALLARGERVGLLQVRLYRPFPAAALLEALPTTVTGIAVLDRTKEPGAAGEPLYQDVVSVVAQAVMDGRRPGLPTIIAGRYGLSSKEFTPAMAAAVLAELTGPSPRHSFTVGITDDVTHLSLAVDPTFRVERPEGLHSAVFYGLGSDGTVGANKNTVKIVGEHTDLHTQGFFQYDSKKSGAMTVSHLRFSPAPISSTYLVDDADFVGIHQFGFLDRPDILERARDGATLLVNSPFGSQEVWDHLPREVQETIIERRLRLFVVDGYRVAREVGLGSRINTVMQPCFFALGHILPREQALAAIRDAIRSSYAKRGPEVIEQNLRAVDRSLEALEEVPVPAVVTATRRRRPTVPKDAPDFVQRVTSLILEGHGDRLPVSAMPVDGTFPTATARWEKRALAQDLPSWDPSICIDCGKCVMVCPHAAIRMKAFDPSDLEGAPDAFLSKPFGSRELPGTMLSIQVAPDDCTACAVCVDICPVVDRADPLHKALDMVPAVDRRAQERANWDFFTAIAPVDRTAVRHDDVKHSQLLEPLFEFSGACAGCGETPYLRLLTQLFGDRTIVANATGCSSIFGGNLPTTPWAVDAEGRGPAWSNSLFEDNAEFGLGMRIALDQQADMARHMLGELRDAIGLDLVDALLEADQSDEAGVQAQRQRIAELRARLDRVDAGLAPRARQLDSIADTLVRTGVWIVGGDGWAYDIGFGGLDHVLASGLDVNILVLDTEVYSNTGGQASKATPRGAVAKFAANGKATPKKDLGLLATQYGHVYVAQVALGADQRQTLKAFAEAEAWSGPSLILAYSTCIEHGIDMATSMSHQRDAVQSGYWPLYRYHPGQDAHEHPFQLDSRSPKIPLAEFLASEGRYARLVRTDPERAAHLLALTEADVAERWHHYEQLTTVERTVHPE